MAKDKNYKDVIALLNVEHENQDILWVLVRQNTVDRKDVFVIFVLNSDYLMLFSRTYSIDDWCEESSTCVSPTLILVSHFPLSNFPIIANNIIMVCESACYCKYESDYCVIINDIQLKNIIRTDN